MLVGVASLISEYLLLFVFFELLKSPSYNVHVNEINLELFLHQVNTELNNIAITNNDDRILHCCMVYQYKILQCKLLLIED